MADLKGVFLHESDEWETPQELFDELNAEFAFNLDPCSSDNNAKCANHYTIADDGLSKNWGGAGYGVTRHIAKSVNGSKSVTGKVARITPLSFC